MKRIDIDILWLSEMRWPDSGDFWSGEYRVIYSGSRTGYGVIEKALKAKKSLVIALINVGKTFDNIIWNILFRVLKDLNVDYIGRRMVLQLYKNQMALIEKQKLEANISKRVRQGCGFLPLLFNTYNEVNFNGRLYNTISFAEDIALKMSVIWRLLWRMGSLLSKKCKMRVNEAKTRAMK
ncbi:hypothetical protein J437_LFUL014641 [Ladona fulva]|uniref:Reverse transcriptase domain-containing protein n=1 Tax=Ladona fulva TaxID=123851 RepID=A0A8K0P712_LADFU|nr:hypothetical protein J437_LFUL014641 [Ladona fulva]